MKIIHPDVYHSMMFTDSIHIIKICFSSGVGNFGLICEKGLMTEMEEN